MLIKYQATSRKKLGDGTLSKICEWYYQELMSGEAAKECVTTAYTRVPSKSKLLTNELPNKEKNSSNQAS